LGKDTADTLVGVDVLFVPDVNVTLLSPVSTPGVLDDEGFEDTDLGVADSEDGVVKGGTASGLEDTRAVELEGILISFDEYGDWLGDQSSLEGVSAVSSDELVTTSDLGSLGFVVLAVTIFSSVGIIRFEFETVLGSIFDSKIRITTITTLVCASVTVNDLLFREGEELA